MAIRVYCKCEKGFFVADAVESKRIKCPFCQQSMLATRPPPPGEFGDDDDDDDDGKPSRRQGKTSQAKKKQKLLIYGGGGAAALLAIVILGFIISKAGDMSRRALEQKKQKEIDLALLNLGPSSTEAFAVVAANKETTLPQVIEAAKDGSPSRRQGALRALDYMKIEPSVTIPIYTAAVLDPEDDVQMAAIELLAKAGPQAKPAIANLAHASGDKTARVQEAALKLVDGFGVEAVAAIPIFTEKLSAEPEFFRQTPFLTRLSRFGPEAKQAAPVISKILTGVRDELKSKEAALATEIEKGWQLIEEKRFDKSGRMTGSNTYWQTSDSQKTKSFLHPYRDLESRVVTLKSHEKRVAEALSKIAPGTGEP